MSGFLPVWKQKTSQTIPNSHSTMDINDLRRHYEREGCRTLLVKELAPNDNTKNQIYLGGDFTAINLLPFSSITSDASDKAHSKRDRLKADIRFRWLTGPADCMNANLILYPKYPEVRLSGVLGRSRGLSPEKQKDLMNSRDEGRLLFLGVGADGAVIAHAASRDDELAASYRAAKTKEAFESAGVFHRIPLKKQMTTSRDLLLAALRDIINEGWIVSKRLDGDGNVLPCTSSNCGGYTLEAALGIRPNSLAEPDYEGWEVKQYGVKALDSTAAVPITLMTPEPDGGLYKEQGVIPFIRKYGYVDRTGKADRTDRLNFGGVHKVGLKHPLTNLTLIMRGCDAMKPGKWEADGTLQLVAEDGEVAASWSFAGLLKHWNRKHAKAVYVRSVRKVNGDQKYRYSPTVSLGEGTEFGMFLNAFKDQLLYHDPGIKLEGASSGKPVAKRRNQFRIKSSSLSGLYQRFEHVDVNQ